MNSEQLTMEHFEQFQEHFRALPKQQVILQLWAMYLQTQFLENQLEALKEQASQSNANYLSRCRSVGGVTLPPGV